MVCGHPAAVPLRLIEYLYHFSLENRNIELDSEPDFLYVHTKIVMDEFVAHSGNVLPRDMSIHIPQLI